MTIIKCVFCGTGHKHRHYVFNYKTLKSVMQPGWHK